MRFSLRFLLVGFALVTASLFAFSGAASAQSDDGTAGAYVGSETVTNTPALTPEVQSATATASSSSAEATPVVKSNTLAFTGTDVAVLALMGGLALVAGAGFLIVRRKTVQLA